MDKISKIDSAKEGIILLLDVLGVKGHSIDESLGFLEVWHDLITTSHVNTVENATLSGRTIPHRVPEYNIFGDTVIIMWKCDNVPHDFSSTFMFASEVAANLIRLGVEKGLFLRGAISIGEYVNKSTEYGKSTIGPAVADSASWYEEADWFGVIATPHCSIQINRMIDDVIEIIKSNSIIHVDDDSKFQEALIYDLKNRYVEYKVPRKNKEPIKLKVLNWQIKSEINKNEITKWLSDKLRTVTIPIGTENKYNNVITFFNSLI